MGYTRYWRSRDTRIDPITGSDKFSADFVEEVKKIVAIADSDFGIKLGDGWGEGKPVISENLIELNGREDLDEDCESFVLEASSEGCKFQFCKTERLPYDSVVLAVLRLARDYGYVQKISSDGPNKQSKANALYHVADGRYDKLKTEQKEL